MNIFVKIILIIFAAAYFISPVDLIPDFLLPVIGWIDDTLIAGIVLYLMRYGKLPDFSRKNNKLFNYFYKIFKQRRGNVSDNTSYHTKDNFSQDRTENNSEKVSKTDPYDILEIDKNATKEEIQAAYKKLAKQYHPDKVSHLGEELQKVAREKFIKIKTAYDTLMEKL